VSSCWLVRSDPEGFTPIDVELVHLGTTSAVVRLPDDAVVPAGLAGLVVAGPPWRALLVEVGAHHEGPERRLAVLASDDDGGRGRPGRHPRH
jgi:hypothetical protein